MRNLLTTFILAVVLILPGMAMADTSYSTDFSDFETGSFVGQNGWTGNASSGLSGGTALDEGIVDVNGNRVFRYSNAVTSGNYASRP